ncbi:MAG: tetratricopeptide repeat protein, partial [Bacteroidota bacterium]
MSLTLACSACVTTKKSKQDVGWIGKRWHDMNARYNGLFNAKELIKSSTSQLEDSHTDNFAQVLTIDVWGSPEDREVLNDDMDIVVEKVTKVAALHEPSKWLDDCYVLMGKAQYLKGDLESAEETLEYFVDDFNPKDPDSRVYETPSKDESAKQRKKQQKKERKIKEEERQQAREDKEKERKEKAKQRKKEAREREKQRKQRIRDRKKGKRTPPPTAPAEIPEESPTPDPTITASTNDEIVLDEDEAYLREIAAKKNNDDKIKEDGGGGLFKQRPAYYEGMLWLAKTYVDRGKWIEANYYLDKIGTDPGVAEDIRVEAEVERANYFLQQKDFASAIPALESALELKVDKKRKARIAYILAQAYQLRGESAKAYAAYDRVGDYRPTFEMGLQADINKFKNSWSSGQMNTETAVRKLNRLAKEDKFAPYRGSIYSAIAEIYLVSGDETAALEYFQKALGGAANGAVKTEIYYRLGTLYFNREDYTDAKLYYDSTLTVMSEKDDRYAVTKLVAGNLTDIALYINLIETKDSILRLGNLSQGELEEYAKGIAIEAWEQQLKESEAEQGGFTATTTVISGNSKFFAYNQTSKQRGRQDFLGRWGDRPLVDNWRLRSKIDDLAEQQEEEQEERTIPDAELLKGMNKVLREIPTDVTSRQEVNAEIEEAMFLLGTGFRTRLERYEQSNETLQALLDRYPDTEHRPEAYYFIYLNYQDLQNASLASTYRTKLMTEYPDSEYALYLADPTGKNVLMTDERKISVFYDETYELFQQRMYQEAFDRLEQAKETFGKEHELIAKYDLLKAMCIGNLKGQDEYINALRGVILVHKNTPEQSHAREMLRFLRGDQDSFANGGEVDEEMLRKFSLDDDKLHYVIAILYNPSDEDIKKAKAQITKFNEENYATSRLRSTQIVLSRELNTKVILIRRFA